MKIVIINSIFWPDITGGSQISTRMLAEDLSSKGHNVSVITQSHENQILNKDGYTIFYVKKKIPFKDAIKSQKWRRMLWFVGDLYDSKIVNHVVSIIKAISPDIVHTNCIQGFSCRLWYAIKKMNIPIVHTLRDYYLICPYSLQKYDFTCNGSCLACRAFNYSKKKYSFAVDAVVGVSNFILEKHIERDFFLNAKFKLTIPNAFAGTQKHILHKTAIWGFIGRIVKAKGLELALDCFCKLSDNNLFYIAGNGDEHYLNYLKQKYQDKRIKFLGFVDSLDFFKMIDILVVPSVWPEPFGRVAIEAVANGVYIVVANSGGLSDIVNDLHYGTIFNKEIPDDLLVKMKFILDNALYVKSINENKLQKYSSKTITNLYVELYELLVRGNS